jgi:hypothetical protein
MALAMLLPVSPGLRADWKQLLPHLVGCYLVCLIKGLLLLKTDFLLRLK